MQKLERRDTYTPTDASQVRGNREILLGTITERCDGNCDSVIKHGMKPFQVLQDSKTLSNNPDVNQQSGRTGQDLRVPVLNMRGEPLMPTNPAKARHLLKQNKAKVMSRKPFTIQLNYATGETKQPITLGIDSGYKTIGFSAITEKKELISGEVALRTDISKLLEERMMYRRIKRNKLWYRQPRFDNRRKDENWLAPSIKHKLDTHIRLVNKIKKLLPVTEVIVEVAKFDIQKIKNPEITGEQYQQGEQLGFWNVREYVLHRDNHICQHCFGKKKDKILEVHHINGKKEGATNRPEELLTICKTCHEEHHTGIDIIPKKEIKQFKPETFMSSIRWKLINILNCEHTYGYITKSIRVGLKLPKLHVNDAFVIAGGTSQERCRPFDVKQVRRNNRCIQINRKGFKPAIRKKHYSLQPHDKIIYKNNEYLVRGIHSKGTQVMIFNLIERMDVNVKKIKLICYGKGMQFFYEPKLIIFSNGVL